MSVRKHSVTLTPDTTASIRETITETNLPDGFRRDETESRDNRAETDWLTGKFGEALFAKFLRREFSYNATIQLDFEEFVYSEEADTVVGDTQIGRLDVKTVGPDKRLCPIMKGAYESHPTDNSFVYVIVSLDDGQDVHETEQISGVIDGAILPPEIGTEHLVEQGEPVTTDSGYELFTASVDQYLLRPFSEETSVHHLTTEQWHTRVCAQLDFPEPSVLDLAGLDPDVPV